MSDLHDIFALVSREFGNADPLDLALHGGHWVMDLDSYKQIRAAAGAAGYPEGDDDPDTWVPSPEDRLFGLAMEVRADAGVARVIRGEIERGRVER